MTEEQKPIIGGEIMVRGTDRGGLVPKTFTDMWRMAQAFHGSGLLPAAFNTPEQTFVALEYCLENDLKPFTAMRWLMVVNNRIAEWGDLVVGRVLGSGKCRDYKVAIIGEGDDMAAVVQSRRSDSDQVIETRFSVDDAKAAGLWGKAGPWKQYPRRMLEWRAKHWHFRDYYADVLQGVLIAEEVIDYDSFDASAANGAEPPTGRIETRTMGFGGDDGNGDGPKVREGGDGDEADAAGEPAPAVAEVDELPPSIAEGPYLESIGSSAAPVPPAPAAPERQGGGSDDPVVVKRLGLLMTYAAHAKVPHAKCRGAVLAWLGADGIEADDIADQATFDAAIERAKAVKADAWQAWAAKGGDA